MKRTAKPTAKTVVKAVAKKATPKTAKKSPAVLANQDTSNAVGKAVGKATAKARKAAAPKAPVLQTTRLAEQSPTVQANTIVAWLKNNATKATRDGMVRYALPTEKAFGVPVGVMLKEAKRLGRNHDVALALWDTGWFEARMMATYLGQPERMTSAEMDKWCNESDNWGICDTASWHVYERSPHAWAKIEKWGKQRGEFQKRTALALLATIALHDKVSGDAPFANALPLVEKAAADERNFVFKGANWALRSIGLRSAKLRTRCIEIAERLAESSSVGARWAGKDALRKLSKTPPKKKSGM
jgi:3-methyladenine DNA glycosylase AlkD